jgi:hypothetical protein
MHRKIQAAIGSFSAFISVRMIAALVPIVVFQAYFDAYLYYVPAGIAYVKGALPDSVNPEHPPLAKYIIGFFAVYFNNAALASLLFSVLTAVVAFYLVEKMGGNGSIAVWLLAFEIETVSLALYPMLDGFMLTFALLGLYFIWKAARILDFTLAGVSFGLAIASKWEAFFLAVPVLIFIISERKWLAAGFATSFAVLTYTCSYLSLIIAKGFGAFIELQIWMAQFALASHGPMATPAMILNNLLAPLIFHTTTYGSVTGYNSGLHPEAFRLFGTNYISFADSTGAPLLLLYFPVMYWCLRKWQKSRASRLILLLLIGILAWEISLGSAVETWFFAPAAIILAVALGTLLNGRPKLRSIDYMYLVLAALWPIVAASLILVRIAFYWTAL